MIPNNTFIKWHILHKFIMYRIIERMQRKIYLMKAKIIFISIIITLN